MTAYSKIFGEVRDSNGVIVPSRAVTVYATGTLTPAALFEDNDSTAKTNPFLSGLDGSYEFNVAAGSYDIAVQIDPFTILTKTNVPASSPSGGGGGTTLALQNSPCNLDSQSAPANAGGSDTTGRSFYPAQLLKVVGIKFYWSGPALTILGSLWNSAGTKVASGSVVVTATPGVFSITFGTPYNILSADLGKLMIVSISESTGTDFQNGANPSLVPAGSFSPPGILWGHPLYSAGIDTLPATDPSPAYYITEPIFG